MRHIYIRAILAFVWFAAGIICGVNGSVEMAALYSLIGIVFAYSAFAAWKKEKGKK